MELTPQTLHAVEFREARRGGYNTRDVDDFLERVAAGIGHLHDRLRELAARADTAEARLLDTQRQLDEAQRRAAAPVPPTPGAPAAVAARINETDDTLRRTLVLAQRTADATIKEAKQEANRLLEEARAEASRTRASAEDDARRGADQARASIEAELDSLVDQRDALKSDVEALNQHIDDQRERLRAGIDELRRIVDDESLLAPAPAPSLADVGYAAAPPLPSRAAFASGTGAPAPLPPAAEPVDDVGSPFASAAPGAHVSALQEPADPDAGSATQPMPFTVPGDVRTSSGHGGGDHVPSGAGSRERLPWLPSELRTSVGDGPPPPSAPPPPPDTDPFAAGAETQSANGTESPADTETRPSEWGRAVFGPDPSDTPDNDRSPFG
jgi:DivIVA domain-containing protein